MPMSQCLWPRALSDLRLPGHGVRSHPLVVAESSPSRRSANARHGACDSGGLRQRQQGAAGPAGAARPRARA